MTIKSGMFNSVNRDRVYKAEDFASYFAAFIANGVFPNPSTGLQVLASGNGMNLILKPGRGWIYGYYVTNDADHTLTLATADPVLKRIDRVVMQLNYLNRNITISIKKGTPSATPVAPALTRNVDIYELALADITVNNGVLTVTQGSIVDTRLNNSLCGIVHGILDQVDTTTIFNQYNGWFEESKINASTEMAAWQSQQQQQFMDWFSTIQDILDGNVAVNLANRIALLEQQMSSHLADYVKHPGTGTITRTGNLYEITLNPAPTAYVDLMGVIIKADADVTGQAITMNVNGLGVKSVLTPNGTNPSFKKGSIYTVRWNGTAFILQGEGEVYVGRQIITPSTVNQAITKGIHDGTGLVIGSPSLLPSNIKKNVTIFGVTGTFEGDLVGFEVTYLQPVTTPIPEGSPFYTIPMTGGLRIAEFIPNAGPKGDRDYMNGGSYPSMQNRSISNSQGYGTNGILYITVKSSDGGSWTYAFPKGYNIWFPWFTVTLTGTSLYLRAYFEYDGPVIGGDYSQRVANAVTIFTNLANGVKDISSIEFRADWEYSGATHTSTTVQGAVYKYK